MTPLDGLMIGGGLIGAMVALIIAVLAYFRDRSAGWRRCPKCWADMSRTAGLACPKCRFQAGTEEQLHGRRRRRGVACAAIVMALVFFGVSLTPKLRREGPASFAPPVALGALLPRAPGPILTELERRYVGDTAPRVDWSDNQWARVMLARQLAGVAGTADSQTAARALEIVQRGLGSASGAESALARCVARDDPTVCMSTLDVINSTLERLDAPLTPQQVDALERALSERARGHNAEIAALAAETLGRLHARSPRLQQARDPE